MKKVVVVILFFIILVAAVFIGFRSKTRTSHTKITPNNLPIKNGVLLTRIDGISPTWSGDSKNIAFASFGKTTSGTHIYITELNSNKLPIRITPELGDDVILPHWSYDNKYIAYLKIREGWYSLKITTPDGKYDAELTNIRKTDTQMVWSPDSKFLIFDDVTSKDRIDIYLLDIHTREKVNLTSKLNNPVNMDAAWSPDGKYIMFSSGDNNKRSIWRLKISNNNLKKLTKGLTNDCFPKYSLDGKKIAFIRNNNIYLMTRNGLNQNCLVRNCDNVPFSWSSDGKIIAFQRLFNLWLKNIKTHSECSFTEKGVVDVMPVWSPDGEKLVFTFLSFVEAKQGGNSRIYLLERNQMKWTKQLLAIPEEISNIDKSYILNKRGVSYYDQGKHDRAIEVWKKAININPQFVNPYNNIGMTYRRIGENSRALEFHIKAQEVNPNYTEAYYNAALTEYSRGDFRNAAKNAEKAVQLDPNNIDRLYTLACCYHASWDYDNTIVTYNKIIEKNPNHIYSYINLLSIYMSQKKDKEVENIFQKLKAIKSGISDKISQQKDIAMTYIRNGKYLESGMIYQDLIDKYPLNRLELYGELYYCYWEAGYRDKDVFKLYTHYVKEKETLWSIAGKYFGEHERWRELYDSNHKLIDKPELIHPGQLLFVPVFSYRLHKTKKGETLGNISKYYFKSKGRAKIIFEVNKEQLQSVKELPEGIILLIPLKGS